MPHKVQYLTVFPPMRVSSGTALPVVPHNARHWNHPTIQHCLYLKVLQSIYEIHCPCPPASRSIALQNVPVTTLLPAFSAVGARPSDSAFGSTANGQSAEKPFIALRCRLTHALRPETPAERSWRSSHAPRLPCRSSPENHQIASSNLELLI